LAVGRPLLAADEVRRLHANQVIVHERGKPDQQLQRLNYLKDAEYEGKWDANPDGH
jgi:type IV secretory pathway TraG/TraD family ATPase VirD4